MSQRNGRLKDFFSGAHLSRASKYRIIATALQNVDDLLSDSSSDSPASSSHSLMAESSLTPKNTQGRAEADDESSDAGSVFSWSCSSCSSDNMSDCDPDSDLYSRLNNEECDGRRSETQVTSEEGVGDALRKWFMEYDVSQASLGGLLQGLHQFLPDLPKDPRTIIGKIHVPVIEKMGGGQYINFGLKNQLRLALLKHSPGENAVFLTFHIDGFPLFKSSGLQLTPILFSMYHAKDLPPFVVCIYAGKSKPTLSEFLKDFVVELKELLSSGILVKEVTYSVKVRCSVCFASCLNDE